MTFEAKYSGRCGVCDGSIQPGQQCAYSEDVIVHADCPEVSQRPRSTAACPKCWTVLAVNGECGCDE